jgi:hypothetical protein
VAASKAATALIKGSMSTQPEQIEQNDLDMSVFAQMVM